jgi:hypothetical protein
MKKNISMESPDNSATLVLTRQLTRKRFQVTSNGQSDEFP